MNRGNLPPQAFSSKDMSQALKWLEAQPKHIKDMAKSSEALISLYRRATIYKEDFYDQAPPVSEERFRQDLNDIASQLNSFSDDQKKQSTKTSQISPLTYDENENSHFIESTEAYKTPKIANKPETRPPKMGANSSLDSTSQERLTRVKEKLNLSSEQEALRMLIALGYERFLKL